MQKKLIDGLDIWWTLKTEDDIKLVGIEIREHLEQKFLPFLEKFNNFTDLNEFMENIGWSATDYPLELINIALVKNKIGQTKEAITVLDSLIINSDSAWVTHARRIKNLL